MTLPRWPALGPVLTSATPLRQVVQVMHQQAGQTKLFEGFFVTQGDEQFMGIGIANTANGPHEDEPMAGLDIAPGVAVLAELQGPSYCLRMRSRWRGGW